MSLFSQAGPRHRRSKLVVAILPRVRLSLQALAIATVAIIGLANPASAQLLELDANQVVEGSRTFMMFQGGNAVGPSTFDYAREGGRWILTETAVLESLNVSAINRTTVDAETFRALEFRGTGTMFGFPVDITAEFSADRVSGTSVFPRDPNDPEAVLELDDALGVNTFERTSVFMLAHALPFDDDAVITLGWFSTYEGNNVAIEARVTGREEVTVAAGTFEAWRVELTGGSPSQILWVSIEEQRRIVKMEVVGTAWTYELQEYSGGE